MLKGVHSVHFIGIGGIGMSGLARILLEMGYRISGSDICRNRFIKELENSGAYIWQGHSSLHLARADLVVVSSAISPDNPELKKARRMSIPVISRGELLAYLVRKKDEIIVAGTHGKTTTTSLIWAVLNQGNKNPTVFIGGEVKGMGGNSRLGTDEYAVVESDESDGSFLLLHPRIAVITSLEDDHLDYYGSEDKLLEAFAQFGRRLRDEGTLIVNTDDENLRRVLKRIPLESSQRLITYGIDSSADLLANEVSLNEFSSSYTINYQGGSSGQISLPLPGRHNVYNSLGAIGAGIALGIGWEKIRSGLSSFQGIRRRFEQLGETSSHILVIDDYAHHPTEIKAALRTAKGLGRRMIVIFQPHRYTRTKLLLDKFACAFQEADLLLLTNIYAAGEAPLAGVDGKTLFKKVKKHRQAHYLPRKEQILNFLREKARKGDLVLTLGAGDIREVGRQFLNRRDDG